MKADIENLIRVSTYAKKMKKTPSWIYKLARKGELNIIEIDGVKFVIV